MDIDIAGDFIVMASTLAKIKSRMLLPSHEEDEEDPRLELVKPIEEYLRMKSAAEKLAAEGIDVEIIDLRTVDPLDRDMIIESVKKSSRLVIVQETWADCSISSEIAALAVSSELFFYLDAPVERVTAKDVPIPFSPPLEEFVLPSEQSIIDAVNRVLDREVA